MNRQQQILALLIAKFGQARKDGLENLARTIAGLTETEDEAKAMVDKLTPEKIKEQETAFRSVVDSESQKAAATREKNLRDQYDFTEKKQDPPTPPTPPTPPQGGMTPEAIAKMIQDGITAGLKPYQDKLEAMEAKSMNDVRRGKLVESLGQVPETYKNAIVAAFEAQKFADDAAFDAYVEQQKTAAAELSKSLTQNQLGFMGNSFTPPSGGGNGGVSAAVQAFVKDKAEADAKPVGKEI